MLLIRQLLDCVTEAGSIHAESVGDEIRFTYPSDGDRSVVWRASEPEVARACGRLDREAREDLGMSGLGLLCVHLEEELETFEGRHGLLRLTPDGFEVEHRREA